MTFDKNHWKKPRETIANRFFLNDYGYILHAGKLFIEFLRVSNIQHQQASQMRMLDFGCGTGRVTWFFNMFFKECIGYDPVKECIEESKKEQIKAGDGFIKPYLTHNIEDVSGFFDVIVCINVLEHLSINDFNEALMNMKIRLKERGSMYLWIHKITNSYFFSEHNLPLPDKNIAIVRGSRLGSHITFERI